VQANTAFTISLLNLTFAGIKYVVDTVQMSTTERVFVQNFVAAILVGFLSLGTGELKVILRHDVWNISSIIVLAISSVIGVGISYTGFELRAQASATTYSIIGNVCKLLTILINVLIWDRHADARGLSFLGVTLAAAAWYRQAPMKDKKSAAGPAVDRT